MDFDNPFNCKDLFLLLIKIIIENKDYKNILLLRITYKIWKNWIDECDLLLNKLVISSYSLKLLMFYPNEFNILSFITLNYIYIMIRQQYYECFQIKEKKFYNLKQENDEERLKNIEKWNIILNRISLLFKKDLNEEFIKNDIIENTINQFNSLNDLGFETYDCFIDLEKYWPIDSNLFNLYLIGIRYLSILEMEEIIINENHKKFENGIFLAKKHLSNMGFRIMCFKPYNIFIYK
jgi:hypothetical protein